MRNASIVLTLLASCILTACGELHENLGGGHNCTDNQIGCGGATQLRVSLSQGTYDASRDQQIFTYLTSVDPKKTDRVELLMGVMFASLNAQIYSKISFAPNTDLQLMPVGCSVLPSAPSVTAQLSDSTLGVLATATNQPVAYPYNPNISSNPILTVLLSSLAQFKSCTNLIMQVIIHANR
ncbi:MAG: hypothetical protein JST80_00420 [Bdellovibrionales bacterium]|nr:hypothetical protein [Bdellovibrionales bacterium]